MTRVLAALLTPFAVALVLAAVAARALAGLVLDDD